MNNLSGMILLAAEPTSGSWTLLIIFASIAVLISFLCSVWEAVLLSVSRSYIIRMKETNPKAAARLETLKADIDRPLAAILTLNTIAHTAGSTAAGAQAGALLGNSFAVGIFTTVFILLILIGSEIIPKTIGALYWKKLAPFTSLAVSFLVGNIFLAPFVWLSKVITKRLGTATHAAAFGRDDLRAMAQVASEQGHMDPQEALMLRNLLLLRESKVEDIMTPRTVVFMLQMDVTVAEYVESATDSPFSRVPIYGVNRDDVKGFVLRIHLLQAHSRGEKDRRLESFLQPIDPVSAKSTVMAVLARMSKEQEHIALVVDEFGSMRGLVTLEDIVETLVGFEIVDELDENADMQKLARDLWKRRAERMGLDMTQEEVKALPQVAGEQAVN